MLGGWQLEMTTPDGEQHEPVVLIGRQYDRYAAWYVGTAGLEALSNVKLDGETLSGSITPKDHPEVKVKLSAQLTSEDACQGVGNYESTGGDQGQWTFKGKKLDYSQVGELQTWSLKFTTPDYEEHNATLLVMNKDDKYYAWYEGKDHDLPAESVAVVDDQVTLKLTAETKEGDKVSVVFRGTATETSVTGEATYKLAGDTGTFPFTAKRVK